MTSFHTATLELLVTRPRTSITAVEELDRAERRLGMRLPASVREWYLYKDAVSVLAEHSNNDPPIPVREFALSESRIGRLLPIRWENQGVCTWSILLDGSDDPPVFVDADSNGTEWQLYAPNFSTYVYTCVWDYKVVFDQPGLVQAQNGPISTRSLQTLASAFVERPTTFGGPGSIQYRFDGSGHGLLIWSVGDQADWFVGATDGTSLTSALRIVWDLDEVGDSFYDCSAIARDVLAQVRAVA